MPNWRLLFKYISYDLTIKYKLLFFDRKIFGILNNINKQIKIR